MSNGSHKFMTSSPTHTHIKLKWEHIGGIYPEKRESTSSLLHDLDNTQKKKKKNHLKEKKQEFIHTQNAHTHNTHIYICIKYPSVLANNEQSGDCSHIQVSNYNM